MKTPALFTVIYIALCSFLYSKDKTTWIQDRPDFQETLHFQTHLKLNGQCADGRKYQVEIEAKLTNLEELKNDQKTFFRAKNTNGANATNSQLVKLDLTLDGKVISVPKSALHDLLNPLLGKRTQIMPSENPNEPTVILISGPDGAESYEAAFIFESARFTRRQLRSGERGRNEPPIEETRY